MAWKINKTLSSQYARLKEKSVFQKLRLTYSLPWLLWVREAAGIKMDAIGPDALMKNPCIAGIMPAASVPVSHSSL